MPQHLAKQDSRHISCLCLTFSRRQHNTGNQLHKGRWEGTTGGGIYVKVAADYFYI